MTQAAEAAGKTALRYYEVLVTDVNSFFDQSNKVSEQIQLISKILVIEDEGSEKKEVAELIINAEKNIDAAKKRVENCKYVSFQFGKNNWKSLKKQ